MDDLISRRAAIDALMDILDRPNHAEFLYTDEICKALGELSPAQPEVMACGEGELIAQPEILHDGTLMIDVPYLDTVHRVIVGNGRWCKVFYMDDSERRTDG